MRRLLIVAALLLAGCGGSSPTSPGPAPSTTVSLSGRILTTLTDAPVAGATVTIAGKTAGTALDGSWQIDGLTRSTTLEAEVSAPGYLTRNTRVKTENGRTNVAIDLIQDAAPFNLGFYRQMVRDGLDTPSGIQSEPLRRWSGNPSFYIHAVNPKTATALSQAEQAATEAGIRAAVLHMTGGTLTPTLVFGMEPKGYVTGTINVRFVYEPAWNSCGSAFIGSNPGEIKINYDRCACGGMGFSVDTVAHEATHALGFRHTSDGVMNPQRARSCGAANFSAAELYHARIAYSRQPGNLDIDRDPASVVR